MAITKYKYGLTVRLLAYIVNNSVSENVTDKDRNKESNQILEG